MLPAGLSRLFAELTGLTIDVFPAPPAGLDWDTRSWISRCRDSARPWRGGTLEAHCDPCARTHLQRALAAPRPGHRFSGVCGMHQYLLPVVACSEPMCLLTVRAIPRRDRGHPRGSGSSSSDDRFARSVRLLRVLARGMASRREASSRANEVDRLRRTVASHENEEARLRRALARAVPVVRGVPATRGEGSRAHQVVGQLLERIHLEFAQPLLLAHLAEEHRMSRNYLSEVFSREVGMSFKRYLTTLRMQRAQALLRDPRRRVRDIARAVGYASPDRFRAAFRVWAGLSPRGWREALQVETAGQDRLS